MMTSDPIQELQTALEDRDKTRYIHAAAAAKKDGLSDEDIQKAIAEFITKDPKGCTKFIEDATRYPEAMQVITFDEGAPEWEQGLRFSPKIIENITDVAWSVYPRVPKDDPWDENCDKVNIEVVSAKGVVLKGNGLTSRA